MRLGYSVGLGLALAVAAGGVVRAAGGFGPARFAGLVAVFALASYLAADLNIYTIGYGPGGEDSVQYRFTGTGRLLMCAILASAASGLGCLALWLVAAVAGPPGGRGGA